MKSSNLLMVSEICIYHNIEPDFVNSLLNAGLVKPAEPENTLIPVTELQKLEKLINLHRLDINLAGIEAITHLLERVEILHEDLQTLRNRLSRYEGA
ncbi:MerR HTH family regulatory protein [Mucilaginibacter pineti]|uniref:MerR HTH family regulatory protein n=1 Tax=Mucilaginibacter pineti TaxID=1391627 RepID=A0A1G6TDM0_9SPHI|nr:chaperone modulator CbpM [Mucilaginibacter pineti]SDD26954.1 MerR HTH family regulatory protein [Mucilaginibacter pineti]